MTLFVLAAAAISLFSPVAQNTNLCDVPTLLAALTQQIEAVSPETVWEDLAVVEETIATARAACENSTPVVSPGNVGTFLLIANSSANLRSCASTDCEIVGRVSQGDVLSGVGQSGDWYQIQLSSGETAFIAGFLVRRGPDAVISTDEAYFDQTTGCYVAFDIRRGTSDLRVILTGARMREVVVDVFRPNESVALRVQGQLDKTFIDTGEPYIHQYYSWNVGFPLGMYNLEITLDGRTSRLAWEMETSGDYNIFVLCE